MRAEYLLKQWLQTNQTEIVYHDMYSEAMRGIRRHLAVISPIDNSVHTLELVPGRDMQGQL